MNPALNYAEARDRFLAAAEESGFRTFRQRIPTEDGSDFFQDYALLKRGKRLLLHISGVHGIEGYAGSLLQTELLKNQLWKENDFSILFLHALNPVGMALYRRNNGNNVDLNRNFRKGAAIPNPDYKYFSRYLSPSNRLDFPLGFLEAAYHFHKLGRGRATQAIASGQVSFPDGMFYMGTHIQREIALFQQILQFHCQDFEEIYVLDVHTGLGAFGEESLFVDDETKDLPWVEKIFDRKPTLTDPNLGAYQNQGRLSDAIHDSLPKAKIHYCLQEFGTRSPRTTLRAVREELFNWKARRPTDPRPEPIVNTMIDAFFPQQEDWMQSFLQLGKLRCQQILSSKFSDT